MERMPNFFFRMMSFAFKLRDNFTDFSGKMDKFGIQEGDTVIDYGCGPGGYIRKCVNLVGERGSVYAVDIHSLGIKAIEKKIARYGFNNVYPVLAIGYDSGLEDNVADLIYALDMFFMIENPTQFLTELHRLLKPTGVLIIDDGHQPRSKSISKLESSELWTIEESNKQFMKCKPA